MASNPGASNPANVTAVAVATTSASGAPTIKLSGEQATQLLQRLRSLNAVSGGTGTQGIKIQAVQTNPQTGVKHIIAIPIQASGALAAASGSTAGAVSAALNAAGAKLTVSPLKMRATPVAVTTSGMANVTTMPVHTTTSVLGPNVKVVKLAASATPPKIQQQVSTPVMQSEVKYVASMLDANSSSSRKRSDIDFDAFVDAKRKKTDKGGKGLRHFSMKVCEKVQAKGSTSYNEVADELVAELTNPRCASPTDQQYDQKNIRRRVYDALNVLMAMNIISKEKKEIHWLGLPTNSIQEANNLEKDKAQRMERIKAKTQQLQDLILQQIAFKNLVERNKDREKVEGPPAPNSAIHLPFIIVNTSKKTVIDCRISNDKMEYLFNFDDTFEIHDDMEVLKRMGMSLGLECGQVSQENLAKARTMVPRALEQYVTELAEHGPGSCTRMPEVTEPVFLQHGDNGDYSEDQLPSEPDSDSDVDIY